MNRYFRAASGHSHLYPGQTLQPVPLPKTALRLPERGTTYLSLEFSDGITVIAEFRQRTDGNGMLIVPAHRTARGTDVAKKRWPVTLLDGPVWKLGRPLKPAG